MSLEAILMLFWLQFTKDVGGADRNPHDAVLTNPWTGQ